MSRGVRAVKFSGLLIAAVAVIVLGFFWLSRTTNPTTLSLFGKSRVWIAQAAGQPITTTWTQKTCRTVGFPYKVLVVGPPPSYTRSFVTKQAEIAIGPASWDVVYKQNNATIYQETWAAGDGSGPAADFDDTKEDTSGLTVTFGTSTSCSLHRVEDTDCQGVVGEYSCNRSSAGKFSLNASGYYGAELAVGSQQVGGSGNYGSISTETSIPKKPAVITSFPRGWTVIGGTP